MQDFFEYNHRRLIHQSVIHQLLIIFIHLSSIFYRRNAGKLNLNITFILRTEYALNVSAARITKSFPLTPINESILYDF